MRHIYLATVLGTFALGLPCLTAHATGNVLVPDDSSSSNDLDLTPSQSSESSDQAVLPKADPGEPDANGSAPSPSDAGMSAIPANPTHVVQLPVPETVSTPASDALPHGLNIDVADKYAWGNSDLGLVNTTIGIAKDQVPQHCHLSIGGMVQSDDGVYAFDMNPALTHTVVRYDGKLTGATIHAQAMCDMLPLPPNAGYIMQMGDKYSVFLWQTSCPPPPETVQQLVFQYGGDGDAKCEYR